MNLKLLSIVAFCVVVFNFFIIAQSNEVIRDPREIIIKPKAKNGLLLFKVKYWSYDFKLLVKKAMHEGYVDKNLLRKQGINENNIINILYRLESFGRNPDRTGIYYNEIITATIKNQESKQEFKVTLHPILRRAFIPGITIGKYKFEKLTLTITLGPNNDIYNCDLMLGAKLPEFTINSNTAFIYGLIDLRKGEIKQYYDEKSMDKLRKYVQILKKFKRYEKLKVIELNNEKESNNEKGVKK